MTLPVSAAADNPFLALYRARLAAATSSAEVAAVEIAAQAFAEGRTVIRWAETPVVSPADVRALASQRQWQATVALAGNPALTRDLATPLVEAVRRDIRPSGNWDADRTLLALVRRFAQGFADPWVQDAWVRSAHGHVATPELEVLADWLAEQPDLPATDLYQLALTSDLAYLVLVTGERAPEPLARPGGAEPRALGVAVTEVLAVQRPDELVRRRRMILDRLCTDRHWARRVGPGLDPALAAALGTVVWPRDEARGLVDAARVLPPPSRLALLATLGQRLPGLLASMVRQDGPDLLAVFSPEHTAELLAGVGREARLAIVEALPAARARTLLLATREAERAARRAGRHP